jgi:transcriptional regulator with XRE-family HTH domain
MLRRSLSTDRLRAACRATGKTDNVIAGEAGIRHSTLSRVLSGMTEKMNPPTLAKLALALRVPPEWLTGERHDLPYVPEFGTPRRGDGKPASLWERPTIDYVRYSWFLQRVDEAVRRDLRQWFGEKWDSAYQSWGRHFLYIMSYLASSLVWRMQAHSLSGPRGGAAATSGTDDVVTINWIEHILGPWLDGEDYLNTSFVSRLYEAVVATSIWHDEIRDRDAFRVLAEYAAKESEVSQARLAEEYAGEEDDGEPSVGPEFVGLEDGSSKSKGRRAPKRQGKRRVRRNR